MLMKASTEWDTADLQKNMKKMGSDLEDQIDRIMDYHAAWGTTWMKMNAPWTDDTGAARSSLVATASNRGSVHEITVAHGVHYGIWLEVANSGRFQILAPAMRAIARNVLMSFEGILNGSQPKIMPPTREIMPQPRKPTSRNHPYGRRGHRHVGPHRPGRRRGRRI